MDENDARRWFRDYLSVFEACGRGDREASSLLEYWDVPLLIQTRGGSIALTTEDQVLATAQQQIDGMRAVAYERSDLCGSEFTALGATSALYRAEISRQRVDGEEISRLRATYLLTDRAIGHRIKALVVHDQ
ncbi:MAG: hypothetical protein JO244_13340 [Solirubrobacterales bacterium]|nr:hypothetical protein [Solirubrobacterales bacterium]